MREPDRLRPAEATALEMRPATARAELVAVARPRGGRAGDPVADPGLDTTPHFVAQPVAGTRGWRRLALTGGALTTLWGGLTGWDPASWVFGVPVVLAATALAFRFAPAPAWRLSPVGALRFAGWFAVAAARGSWDVALRALRWRVALRPGFRRYRTTLPPGPARILFANAITLLPGTLTAEFAGDRLEVHMLDTAADLGAELGTLEARVRALFALPPAPVDPFHLKSGETT